MISVCPPPRPAAERCAIAVMPNRRIAAARADRDFAKRMRPSRAGFYASRARTGPRGGIQSKVMRRTFAAFLAFILIVLTIPAGAVRQPLRARHGMAVAMEAQAADVGIAVLQKGGNAVDAAVAMGFAMAVTHPFAGNLGGGGFMLIRFADGRSTFLDFRERAPEKATRGMYLDGNGQPTQDSVDGWRSSGVPGTVRGFELALSKYGRKKWAELIAPAIGLASKGFPVSYSLAESLR